VCLIEPKHHNVCFIGHDDLQSDDDRFGHYSLGKIGAYRDFTLFIFDISYWYRNLYLRSLMPWWKSLEGGAGLKTGERNGLHGGDRDDDRT